MQNPEDISNPTTALDMALEFMSKAFHLNNTTLTNKNQRSLSNPCYSQTAQSGMNIDQDRHILMVDDNVGNQFRQNVVQNVGHLVGQNAVHNQARAEGNSNRINRNKIRCYNFRGVGHYASNCTLKLRKHDATYLQKQIQIAQKEEVGIQLTFEEFDFMAAAGACEETKRVKANCILENNLQQASTSGTHSDKAPVYELDGSAKLSTKKSTVSSLQEEKKRLKSDFKICEDKLLDKQIQLENKIKELDNILVKTGQSIQMMHMLSPNPDSFYHIEKKMDLGYQNPFYLKQAQQKQQSLYNDKVLLKKHDPPVVYDSEETLQLAQETKFVRDFKSLTKEADESLAKHKALELEMERLLRAVIKRFQAQEGDLKGKGKDTSFVSNALDPLSHKLKNENVELEFQVLNYAKENAHLKTTYKNLFESISVTRTQTKTIIDSLQNKLHDTIYKNAKLRAQLFDQVSKQKDTTKGTSVNTQVRKQLILGKPPSSSGSKLYSVTTLPKSKVFPKVGESNALSKSVTSNLTPSSRKSTVVNNESVIAPGIFRTNPFKASRVDNFVPNKHVKASVRTKPITVSQPHVITKKDVNSITNGFYPKNVESTTRTRRPQPRNNPKNDKVPSKSKSSCLSNKLEKIEENRRSLQSSNYPDHTSSECNNINLGIQNEKYKVICATCKQCLITTNHDECVLQYVNGMKSRKKNQSANVSKSANQNKHKANVKKSKKSGSKESLASPSKPRSLIRWLPTGRIFDIYGKITSSSNTESESDTSVCDNASASNPQKPTNKGFPTSTSFLDRFLKLRRQNSCIYPLAVF
uniref:Integrase, catalytic region, zinc finger, CCHC-type, peptidase aspartic, catalytic n=1 Tax=Tanacetum cinerariifolium TaxID=118510 RepID=A0A6L2MY24_TANCI|nr:hypothetical protein [Tanacetum cinerariifolium]